VLDASIAVDVGTVPVLEVFSLEAMLEATRVETTEVDAALCPDAVTLGNEDDAPLVTLATETVASFKV